MEGHQKNEYVWSKSDRSVDEEEGKKDMPVGDDILLDPEVVSIDELINQLNELEYDVNIKNDNISQDGIWTLRYESFNQLSQALERWKTRDVYDRTNNTKIKHQGVVDEIILLKQAILLIDNQRPNSPKEQEEIIIMNSFEEMIFFYLKKYNLNLSILKFKDSIDPAKNSERVSRLKFIFEGVKQIINHMEEIRKRDEKMQMERMSLLEEREQHSEYTGWLLAHAVRKNEEILRAWTSNLGGNEEKKRHLNTLLKLNEEEESRKVIKKGLGVNKQIETNTTKDTKQHQYLVRENRRLQDLVSDLRIENRYLLGRCAKAYEDYFIKYECKENDELQHLRDQFVEILAKIRDDYDLALMRVLNEKVNLGS